MPFISFIYRTGRNPKTFYGKHVTDYISDDHEGLDHEVKYELLRTINLHRTKQNMPNLKEKHLFIGVMSFSSNRCIPTFSSDAEIKCFDYYRDYKGSVYLNGVKMV